MRFAPEWHALRREAELAAELLATGVTILGRANYAQKGLYNQAFFALSVGFERLAKLVLVADHAIENNGAWLTDQALKSIGHDISALLDACEPIAAKRMPCDKWAARPSLPVHSAIVTRLSEFARLTRYYNLASLSNGKAARSSEPVEAWWRDVGKLILDRHYSAKQKAKHQAQSAKTSALLSPAIVLHHDEANKAITTVEQLMIRAGATRIVQRYGRLYVMQLIRWLSTITHELSRKGADQLRIEALFGLDEPFHVFCNEDRYLLGRETWSIYRPRP
jgi:hypothetical protein